jgi:hypothetical protein
MVIATLIEPIHSNPRNEEKEQQPENQNPNCKIYASEKDWGLQGDESGNMVSSDPKEREWRQQMKSKQNGS